MTLRIRPAEPGDDAALAEMFLGLNRYEDALVHDRVTDMQGTRRGLAEAWRDVAEHNGEALVAERDGQVVGHLFLLFKTDAAYIRPELLAYALVAELFVRPAARGAGIGTALLAEAERITRARGITRMFIGVVEGNDGAHKLYRRFGFDPYAHYLGKDLRGG
jgi:GNAT superfamily N-acetyltransferase